MSQGRVGLGIRRKDFFFEKKKQKTFESWAVPLLRDSANM
jgi:hypothetical protein